MPERSFGRTLRYRRTKLGISQARLGQLVGRSAATIRSWESDKSAPNDPAVIPVLAAIIGIDARTLFDKVGMEPPVVEETSSTIEQALASLAPKDTGPQRERDSEPEIEPELEPEPEPEPESELESELEPEPELESEIEPELEPDPEPEPESELESELEPEPELVLEFESELDLDTDGGTEPDGELSPNGLVVSDPELEEQILDPDDTEGEALLDEISASLFETIDEEEEVELLEMGREMEGDRRSQVAALPTSRVVDPHDTARTQSFRPTASPPGPAPAAQTQPTAVMVSIEKSYIENRTEKQFYQFRTLATVVALVVLGVAFLWAIQQGLGAFLEWWNEFFENLRL